MRLQAIMIWSLVTIMLFSLFTPTSTAVDIPDSGVTRTGFADNIGDVVDQDGRLCAGRGYIDIVRINVTYGTEGGVLIWCTVNATFAQDIRTSEGVQYFIRVGNITSITRHNMSIGPMAEIESTHLYVNFTRGNVNMSSINLSVLVTAIEITGSAAYSDTLLFLPLGLGHVVENTVIRERRVYPHPWNIFGVVSILSFSLTLLLIGAGVSTIGARRERSTGYAMLLVSLIILLAAAHIITTAPQGTLLGVFNWSEVPLMQAAVTVFSAFLGIMMAVTILLIYIIRVQEGG